MKILQVLFLILGLVVFAHAQKSVLSGQVTDHVGAIIQKAKIEIYGSKNQKYSANTNEEGIYEINLPEGIYTIKFVASGHETFVIKKYRMGSSRVMRLDVALYANPTPII